MAVLVALMAPTIMITPTLRSMDSQMVAFMAEVAVVGLMFTSVHLTVLVVKTALMVELAL
jgi:hypothetical protein